MIEANSLKHVFNIVHYGSGNNEIDKLVKDYLVGKDKIYLHIVTYHYLNPTSRRETMNLCNMNLKEYRELRDKIVDDVRQIVYKYYNTRDRKFKKNTKVTDLLNHLK